MNLTLRRVGNSLGVIVPKALLDAWGVGEGDTLEAGESGIRPASSRTAHQALDELKRAISIVVLGDFTVPQIRAQGLANLYRWKEQGVWVPAYDEWESLLKGEDDGALFAAMLGRDERAVRLRQSMPYVGLLPKEKVRQLHEEASR